MKFKKSDKYLFIRGEITTILTIAVLLVIGVTTFISSLALKGKKTTNTRASEADPYNCQLVPQGVECEATPGTAGGAQSVPCGMCGLHSNTNEYYRCTNVSERLRLDSDQNCQIDDFVAEDQALLNGESTESNGGEGSTQDSETVETSVNSADSCTGTSLPFNCCVADNRDCDPGITRYRWYGCTGPNGCTGLKFNGPQVGVLCPNRIGRSNPGPVCGEQFADDTEIPPAEELPTQPVMPSSKPTPKIVNTYNQSCKDFGGESTFLIYAVEKKETEGNFKYWYRDSNHISLITSTHNTAKNVSGKYYYEIYLENYCKTQGAGNVPAALTNTSLPSNVGIIPNTLPNPVRPQSLSKSNTIIKILNKTGTAIRVQYLDVVFGDKNYQSFDEYSLSNQDSYIYNLNGTDVQCSQVQNSSQAKLIVNVVYDNTFAPTATFDCEDDFSGLIVIE